MPDASTKSNHALAPGFRLNEYEIVRVLGQGGFGIVYLANDATLGRQVAIKEYLPVALAARSADSIHVVPRSSSANKRFQVGLKAFVQEARLLARFDHPALVSIHRFWEGNGTSYMVMPYYEGRTLMETRAALARPPTEAWLRVMLTSMLGALDLLHKAQCVHRDISPENILVLNDGRTVLLDFAVLPVSEDSVGQHTTILKPAWAPIEQFAQSTHLPQGPWSDIYSLGAVAYFCVTGHPPPPATVRALDPALGRTPLAQAMNEVRARHPDVHYPPYLLEAIDWALAVRPADRPQDAQALRQMLARPKGGTEAETVASAPVRPAVESVGRPPSAVDARVEPPLGELGASRAAARPAGVAAATPSGLRPQAGGPGPAAAPSQGAAFAAQPAGLGIEPEALNGAPTAGIDASIREAIGAALQGFDNVRNIPPASLPPIGGLDDEGPGAGRGPAGPAFRAQQAQAQARTARAYGAASGRQQPARSVPWKAVAAAAAVVVGMIAWIAIPQWQSAREEARLGEGSPVERSTAPMEAPKLAGGDDGLPAAPTAKAGVGATAAMGAASAAKGPSSTLDALPPTGSGRPSSTASPAIDAATKALTEPPPQGQGGSKDGADAGSSARGGGDRKAAEGNGTVAKATSTVRRVEAGSRAGAAEPADTAAPPEIVADGTPRGACGSRTNFALQRCMQTQCQLGKYVLHPQCSRLRAAGGEWSE